MAALPRAPRQAAPLDRFPLERGVRDGGLSAAGLLLIQLERLLIPHLLPLHDLATYGVLAAIVGSLFRVLQMGVGYSLLPRLRAAPGVLERRRLIAREARLVFAIVALGSAVIWIATPLVERWFLDGKYHLSAALVLAALVTGVAKIMNGFAQSTVSALADARELSVLSHAGMGRRRDRRRRRGRRGRIGDFPASSTASAWAGWCGPHRVLHAARHLRLPVATPAVTS